MNQELDIEHLVMNSILSNFETPEVEQNLQPSSNLRTDLGLSNEEIVYLGLSIERDLQNMNLPSFDDKQILSWIYVSDITKCIGDLLYGNS